MRKNHPSSPECGHGASYAPLELRTGLHLKGMQKLFRASGISVEGIRTVVDLDARDGTTALALAKELPNARVIGISEFRMPYLVARAKWGILEPNENYDAGICLGLWPPGISSIFYKKVAEELGIDTSDIFRPQLRTEVTDRVDFVNLSIETAEISGADLVIGYQLLQWLNADESGLPNKDSLNSILSMLVPGGKFVAGISSGFVSVDPKEKIEGMTRNEYVLDDHEFVRLDYQMIARLVAGITGKMPFSPTAAKAKFTMQEVKQRLEENGFVNINFGAFLVTPGIEEILTDQEGGVLMLRPMHQGRLEGIEIQARRDAIMRTALMLTYRECDRLVAQGKTDPRTIIDRNIWDAVPFVVAEKSA